MAAEFEKTSFGMLRRRRDAQDLGYVRQVVCDRILLISDPEKLKRLEALRDAIDDVLPDLKD